MLELRSVSPHSLIVIVLLLIPMAVRPTSPVLPYHDFHVAGRIELTGGGPLQNYTVALAARGYNGFDGYGVIQEGPRPLAVTSETGSFSISTTVYGLFGDQGDSLAVVVFMPGDDFVQGDGFARDSVRPTEDRRIYEEESDGCCESPVERETIVGYVYHYPDQVVTVP